MTIHRAYDAPRIAVLCALVVVAVVAIRSDSLHRGMLDVLRAAEEVIRDYPRGGMLVFVLLAVVSALFAFFSSAAIVPVGVFVWGRATTMFLLWIGWAAGGAAGYWLSRTLGRRGARWLAPRAPIERYETFAARAPWPLVLLFQMALPSEIPSYVLGLVRYPFLRYLAAVTLAELPFAVLSVYMGEALLRQQAVGFGVVLALAVALSAVLWAVLRRHLERASATARDRTQDGPVAGTSARLRQKK